MYEIADIYRLGCSGNPAEFFDKIMHYALDQIEVGYDKFATFLLKRIQHKFDSTDHIKLINSEHVNTNNKKKRKKKKKRQKTPNKYDIAKEMT